VRKFPYQKRRLWILENTGTVKFTLVQNPLGTGDHVTITGFSTSPPEDGFGEEIYIK